MDIRFLQTYALLLLFTTSMQAKQANILNIADENQYQQEVVDRHKRVLVKFSADWCSVCNSIQRPFEEVACEDEFCDVTFAQVDVDKLDNVSKQHGIVGVPTFVYMENGSKKVEEIGVNDMQGFKNHLRENLRKTFDVAQNAGAQNAGDMIEEVDVEAVGVDMAPAPEMAPPAVAEPNFFMKILTGIKDFVMMIVNTIVGFFMTIVNGIKGLFGG